MKVNTENPKLTQIAEAARELFWKFGYKRVTVEEICKEANVSKMTFYKFFKNKIELTLYILESVTNEALEKYHDLMTRDIPYPEKIKKSIELKLEGTQDISSEFMDDMYKHPVPEILEYFNKKVRESMAIFMKDLTDAQKAGNIRSTIRPEFILYFLNHMMEMLKDDKLTRIYDTPQEMILELMNFFFYGIMPGENEK